MLTQEEYELVVRFLNDALDDDQAARFRVLLRENPEARKALRDFAMIDSRLSEMEVAPAMAFDLMRPASQVGVSGRLAPENAAVPSGSAAVANLGKNFRGLAVRAAVFGLLLGAIASSMGWAIAVPRWVGAG
ncbi:MAG: hypothetical protein ACK53L_20755, partial [Pirellulaceae bacterium]